MYEDVDACLAAETEYKEKLTKQEEEKKAKETERKKEADNVVALYNAVKEAEQERGKRYDAYIEARNKFINKYGSFHMTYSTAENGTFPDFVSNFITTFFRP